MHIVASPWRTCICQFLFWGWGSWSMQDKTRVDAQKEWIMLIWRRKWKLLSGDDSPPFLRRYYGCLFWQNFCTEPHYFDKTNLNKPHFRNFSTWNCHVMSPFLAWQFWIIYFTNFLSMTEIKMGSQFLFSVCSFTTMSLRFVGERECSRKQLKNFFHSMQIIYFNNT